MLGCEKQTFIQAGGERQSFCAKIIRKEVIKHYRLDVKRQTLTARR
jgi:hypothetical protein